MNGTLSLNDITGVSLSRGHMCFDYCYSFYISRRNGKLLFSVLCFLKNTNGRISFEDVPVKEEVFSSLLDLISKTDLIEKAKNFKTQEQSLEVLDEADYSLSIYFETGSVFAKISSKELEKFFFELAEKYT
ncbi:MAG: hypothetical protein Q4D20_02810 [Clostridia bacterium]|nr:hypothetical protein [Clostridia bacterium]